ncbi:MAG: phosphohydrolase, partial [Prevotella sp.]|nr:phosphohydrolase [Prevotella sp.]
PKHALVCERHTGTGLTLEQIVTEKLPLPHREMVPVSIEEQIICFADCFYSKTRLGEEKSVERIRKSISKHGRKPVEQFDKWCGMFL